jgi:hypothetical protein
MGKKTRENLSSVFEKAKCPLPRKIITIVACPPITLSPKKKKKKKKVGAGL